MDQSSDKKIQMEVLQLYVPYRWIVFYDSR